MGFFQQIHRSIFDTALYAELPAIPRSRKVLYVVQLLILASLVAGLSHAYYVLDAKRGIAAPLEDAFSGIAIDSGRLTAQRALPCTAPPRDVAILFNRLFDVPFSVALQGAPPVIVDTAYAPKPGDTLLRIVLAAKGIAVYNAAALYISLPYAVLFPDCRHFSFAAPFITSWLRGRIPSLAVNFILLEAVQCGLVMLLSICFLSLAAFIFRIDRSRTWFHCMSIAGFAVTPVPLGLMLMAVSGTSIPYGGFLLFLVSSVVMSRALRATGTMTSPQNPGDRANHDL